MSVTDRLSRFERFNMSWRRQFVQGAGILSMGLVLAFASLVKPDVTILYANDFSWLPVSATIIFSMGLLECLDAYLAKEQRDFYQNLQVGALDTAVGGLIMLSVGEDVVRVSTMIAAFLMVRGFVRVSLVYALDLPHGSATVGSGLLSVLFGFLIWLKWPVLSGEVLSLFLSLEIVFRGWAILVFAAWLRERRQADRAD